MYGNVSEIAYRYKERHRPGGTIAMKNCYRFFENNECEYFPCHEGLEDFNCLFCYCPLYLREHCPGNPKYIERNGKTIKSCNDCTFPHQPENYDTIIKFLMKG